MGKISETISYVRSSGAELSADEIFNAFTIRDLKEYVREL